MLDSRTINWCSKTWFVCAEVCVKLRSLASTILPRPKKNDPQRNTTVFSIWHPREFSWLWNSEWLSRCPQTNPVTCILRRGDRFVLYACTWVVQEADYLCFCNTRWNPDERSIIATINHQLGRALIEIFWHDPKKQIFIIFFSNSFYITKYF